MFEKRNNASRKLSGLQVSEIRRRYMEGETQGSLSRDFGVSVGQVGRIVRGESWQGPGSPQGKEQQMMLAAKLLEVQKEMEARGVPSAPLPPKSLLDGGDAPDETQGAGASTLLDKAKEYGAR